MTWLTVLITILTNPAVDAWLLALWNKIWARLEARLGIVPAGDVVALKARLDLMVDEVPWYRIFARYKMKRVTAALHARAATGNWQPITAAEMV